MPREPLAGDDPRDDHACHAIRLTLPAWPLRLPPPRPPRPAAAAAPVYLAPHQAVYDLTLAKSHGSRGIAAVRGRILYDFSGNACEGYALKFRQVSELDSGEGKSALSDLRSTTWEDGAAKKFRFNSENLLNDQQTDAVDGHAERERRGGRGQPEQAEAQDASPSRSMRCFRPSTCGASSKPRAPARPS